MEDFAVGRPLHGRLVTPNAGATVTACPSTEETPELESEPLAEDRCGLVGFAMP